MQIIGVDPESLLVVSFEEFLDSAKLEESFQLCQSESASEGDDTQIDIDGSEEDDELEDDFETHVDFWLFNITLT